ncbi:hypothetical protein ACJO5Y_18245 [Marinobacter sp. GN3S48]|uniref:hypothetical protein n=1 Tax=Marinobacter sp. GN3S48 TaxID=3382302 RepID=UPI00387B9294
MFDKTYRVSMQKTYFSLCLAQIDTYRKILADINELETGHVPDEEAHIARMNLAVLEEKKEQAVVAPVISAAMCLEAFSYDYAATHLGDAYTRKHLEKLDVPSRLVIATKLVTGKDFPTDCSAYGNMKSVIKQRNSLVHFKSKNFEVGDMEQARNYIDRLSTEIEKTVDICEEAVRGIMIEIDKLHVKGRFYEFSIEPTQCHA